MECMTVFAFLKYVKRAEASCIPPRPFRAKPPTQLIGQILKFIDAGIGLGKKVLSEFPYQESDAKDGCNCENHEGKVKHKSPWSVR